MVVLISISCLFAAPLPTAAKLDLPAARVPPYEGRRYEAMVPATLDLAERMKLSLHAFTHCVGGPPKHPFPPTQFPCYHFIDLKKKWPHTFRSVPIYGKFLLGAALARLATGSDERLQVDNDWRQAWFAWAQLDPIMHGPEGGRRLSWLALNYLREGDERWLALGHRAVARLRGVAVPYHEGAFLPISLQLSPPDDCCPAPESALPTESWIQAQRKLDPKQTCRGWTATYMAWTLQGLCDFYKVSQDPAALELAGKLARYIKDDAEILGPDGRLLVGHESKHRNVHFHHNVQAAHALLEYGLVSGDRPYVDLADRVYRHLLTFCCPVIGFAPEYAYGLYPRPQGWDNTEGCCSADLVLLALRLTEAGAADYWDDVDRFIRNHIAALQLTDTRPFYQIPEYRKEGWPDRNPDFEAAFGPLIGNFGGWAGVSEWHLPECGPGIMTCCVGNCTRAFYFVWEDIVDYADGTLVVHLMLNRASPWADISSYRPYEGKLQLALKRPCKQVLVRAPEWVDSSSEKVSCRVDGQPREVQWAGRYLRLGPGSPKQVFVLRFPISLRKVTKTIDRRDFPYTLTIKGNTVVAIDPPGRRMPLYQREHYLKDKAPLIRVRRYVGPENLRLGHASYR